MLLCLHWHSGQHPQCGTRLVPAILCHLLLTHYNWICVYLHWIVRLSLLNELWRRWQLPPLSSWHALLYLSFRTAKSACSFHLGSFFPCNSLPVNLCSTPHFNRVRYHFLLKCVLFFFLIFHPTLFFSPSPCSPWGGSLPPPLLPPMGKTSICFRDRNRGERLVDRNIPPSALPPSLFPGICAVWMRVNEGHLVADWEPNMLLLLFLSSSNNTALLFFRCVYSCVDQRHQRSPAANWYYGFHACMQALGTRTSLWVLM